MRIGIDCRMAGIRHAGIGRYVAALITRVVKLEKTINWVLFFSDREQFEDVFPNGVNIGVKVVYLNIKHYSVAEQLILPFNFVQYHLDLLHVPHFNIPIFYPGKMIITIHDLLWHHHRGSQVTTLPGWQYWLKYFFYRLISTIAIYRAKLIIVPTLSIFQTIKKYYPASQGKVRVTYEGYGSKFKASPGTLLDKKKLIYVGSLYPHKNVQIILKMLQLTDDFQLHLVGSRNHFQAQIIKKAEELKVSSKINFLGFLSDQELVKELQSALCIIQPSLSEGFGLPGVEAMATGTVVVASDIPIFREVYQDAALFFDPYQPKDLLNTIKKIDHQKKLTLQKNGFKLIKKYSWDELAKQTIKLYYDVLAT